MLLLFMNSPLDFNLYLFLFFLQKKESLKKENLSIYKIMIHSLCKNRICFLIYYHRCIKIAQKSSLPSYQWPDDHLTTFTLFEINITCLITTHDTLKPADIKRKSFQNQMKIIFTIFDRTNSCNGTRYITKRCAFATLYFIFSFFGCKAKVVPHGQITSW